MTDKIKMAEEPQCQIRRRRSSGNPNLPLNLEMGYQVNECGPNDGTPSPSCYRPPNSRDASTSALMEFRKKQQSFDLHVIQVEECEEEEITVDSDDEGGDENEAIAMADRPITPTPVQDFGASVMHTEGPQASDFLQVKTIEQDGYTDVSDAGSDDEE